MSIEAKISVAENLVFNKYGFKSGSKRTKNISGLSRRKTKYARRQQQRLRQVIRSQERHLKDVSSVTEDTVDQHLSTIVLETNRSDDYWQDSCQEHYIHILI